MARTTTCLRRVHFKSRPTAIVAGLGAALLLTMHMLPAGANRIFRVRAATVIQNSVPVTSVSAASFVGAPAPLAPDSIVAAFGTDLATGTQVATAQPLPTTLLGTTVTVNGTAAPLFFVSPGQINFLVPPSTTAGEVQVVVTSTLGNGDQIVSRGQMFVAGAAPAIFTANANGAGAPAAVTGRVNGNGQFVFDPAPPFEPDPVNPAQVVPSPIDVGTAQQPAFLILYGTGLRSAPAGSVRALIGGIEVPVTPVAAPGFTGLDQINLQIPESLKGKGNVSVNLVANGLSSNTVTVKMAGAPAGNLAISGFNVTDPALAGQTVTINGNGFSATTSENIVRFGNAQARVVSASPSQLNVIVPFGAESGLVTVQTLQGEARSASPVLVRTSVSGIVQSTGGTNTPPRPLENVTIRVVGTNLSVRTNPQGSFVLSDIPPGVNLIEIEGRTNPTNPPFPSVSLKAVVRSGRDNQFSQPISLQQITGGSGNVGSGGSGFSAEVIARMVGKSGNPNSRLADAFRKFSGTGKQGPRAKEQVFTPGTNINISNRGVNLEIPFSTTVRFPDGKTSGSVQLTVVEGSRLPGIELPKGVYSTAIAQITPFGATFSPGASVQFPNPDRNNLPPGSKLDLYRYDSTAGVFVKRGTATVTADGANVNTDGRIIDVASFWFVASPSGITTVTGRVIDLLGFPVPGAIITVNGRSSTSDQNGGFSIADVSTTGNAQIQAEAVIPQQFGTPPRGVSSVTDIVTGGITSVGTIALSDTQQPGLVLAPFMIDFDSNSPPAHVEVTLTQPAPPGGLQVSLTSDEITVATVPANVTIPAGQTTASFNITRVGPGYAFIDATATLANTLLESFAIVTVSAAAPTLTSVTPQSGPPRATITITGTGLSPFPDLNLIGFVRDGDVIAIVDPYDISVVPGPTGAPAVTAVVPHLGPGPAGIVVAVIDDLTGVISDNSAPPLAFTVLQSNVPTPQLTAVTPTSGNPRDQITITGSNFGSTPDQNLIFFLQNGIESPAEILQASASQLVVQVPAFGLIKGPATIVARRIDQDGIDGNNSNALDFTINSDPVAPPNPVLTSVINVATQLPAGKAGDLIRISGTGLGRNYIDLQTGDFGNSSPDLSLVTLTQNGNIANIALPYGAESGTQITTIMPAGLSAGIVQISVITIDFETGLATEQSNNLDFTITESSLQQIDEFEPNDTYEESTDVTPGTIVTGAIAFGDRGGVSIGGITIDFDDGTSEDLSDLFYLLLDNPTTISMVLNFAETADLDLFILRDDGQGGFEIVDASTGIDTTVEQITAALPAGEYLIGVGAYSGSSNYTLTIVEGEISLTQSGPLSESGSRLPVRVRRRSFQ